MKRGAPTRYLGKRTDGGQKLGGKKVVKRKGAGKEGCVSKKDKRTRGKGGTSAVGKKSRLKGQGETT